LTDNIGRRKMVGRANTLLAAFAILVVSCGWAEAHSHRGDADSLAFQIQLDKTEYLSGEGVWLRTLLINRSDDTLCVVLPNSILLTVKIKGTDESGREIKYSGGIINLRLVQQTVPLHPRDTIFDITDLSYYFDQRSITGDTDIVGQVPGVYSVQATYLGRLKSNTLRYSVSHPTGAETQSFAIFRALRKSMRGGKWIELAQFAEDLIQRFPRSVYAPQALGSLYMAYDNLETRDDAKILECWKRLIAAYPDYPMCVESLTRIQLLLKPEEYRAYMTSLANSKPSTLAQRDASRRLLHPPATQKCGDTK
jgi:hypothetical protein